MDKVREKENFHISKGDYFFGHPIIEKLDYFSEEESIHNFQITNN